MKMQFFYRFYTWVDLGYVISDVSLIIATIAKFNYEYNFEEMHNWVVLERYLETIGVITIY